MHVLVTGAAGFIGSTLVDRLLARGDRVLGIDNFDPFYSAAEKRANLASAIANPRFQLLECDVNAVEAVGIAVDREQPDVVIHLAAKTGVRPSVQDPAGYVQANVGGTAAMLDAAARRGVRAFILASSSSVYGNHPALPLRESDAPQPASPYAATKLAAEKICEGHHKLHGGSMLCLRLFTVYGPRQRPDLAIRRFSELIRAGKPVPMFGDGSSERDYTWVGDIVEGLVAATDLSVARDVGFQVVNLGSGRSVRLDRLTEIIGAALGIPPQIEHLPAEPADVVRTRADITKARDLLAFAPKVTLEDGIAQFVRWSSKTP